MVGSHRLFVDLQGTTSESAPRSYRLNKSTQKLGRLSEQDPETRFEEIGGRGKFITGLPLRSRIVARFSGCAPFCGNCVCSMIASGRRLFLRSQKGFEEQ